jgi:hypothetical protein
MSRQRLNLTPKEMHDRRIAQARAATERRKDLKAKLATDHPLCKTRHCLNTVEKIGDFCDYHAAKIPRRAGDRQCLKCGGIAMEGSKLCGFHFEEMEETRNARRAKTARARYARLNGVAS